MIARGLGRDISPAIARAGPFVIFIFLTSLQGWGGPASKFWIYSAKTAVAMGLLWAVRGQIPELRWRVSWEGILAGVLMVVLWIGLDRWYPKLDQIAAAIWRASKLGRAGAAPDSWDPFQFFGQSPAAWFFLAVRWGGSTVVVPPLEELFYRSFLYRYWMSESFESVPLGRFRWAPFIGVSVIFGCTHQQWLAGILCGLILQGLAVWKNRLGDALTAHAAANFLLAFWIWRKGAWQFW